MAKVISVVLILALPALVAADISRFNASPDLERPDSQTRSLLRQEPVLMLMSTTLPAWEVAFAPPTPSCGEARAYPCAAPEYLTRSRAQPDCCNAANAPVLWPHAPRADEMKTVANEPRPEPAQDGSIQPAN